VGWTPERMRGTTCSSALGSCDSMGCTLPWHAMTATLLTRNRALDHGWVVSCACPGARRSRRVTT
jgi:hypothetical protein